MIDKRIPLYIALIILPASLLGQPVLWDTIAPQSPFLLYTASDLPRLTAAITQDPNGQILYGQIVQQSAARSDDQTQRAKIAKSIAFVLAMDRDAQDALTSQERTELAQTLQRYLTEIDPTVQTNNSEYQWRAIELGQFAQAYDLRKAITGPLPEVEARLSAFAEQAAVQLRLPLQLYNNLTAKLAGALGIAALLLKDAHDPIIRAKTGAWLALALHTVETTFFQHHSGAEGRGGYSEGPYYMRYAMMSLIPFFTALQNATGGNATGGNATGGRDLDIGGTVYTLPLNDVRFTRVFEWAAYLRMPDGRMPAFEDTYMNTRFPELAVLSGHLPDGAFLGWANYDGLAPFPPALLYRHISETYDFRIEYLALEPAISPTPANKPPIRHLPEAGYSIFRSGWDADVTYFAMIGKHGLARTGGSAFGSGHKHANETGFVLFSGGQLLAMEPGYYQYSFRDSLMYGKNHNIILVDGKGPDRTALFSAMVGVDAFIEDTLSGQWGGTSTVRTRYEKTDISRTAVFFDTRFVLLRDDVRSTGTHTFTHQIHGNALASLGTYQPDFAKGAAVWQAAPMKLHAHVGAIGQTLSYETATRKHAPSYRVFEDHSAMYSSVTASSTVFHTLLIPASETETVTFTKIPAPAGVYAHSARAGATLLFTGSNTTGAAVAIESGFGVAETDASLSAVATDASSGVTLFLEKMTMFSLAGIPLIASDAPATLVGRLKRDEIILTATGSGLRELTLFLTYQPDTIIGTGFSSYTVEGNRLRIQIPGGRADMRIAIGNTPTSVAGAPAPSEWHAAAAYPNPASGSITVPITSPVPGTATLVLHSTLGKEVYRTTRAVVAPGSAALMLTPPPQLRGVFLLSVEMNGIVTTQYVALR